MLGATHFYERNILKISGGLSCVIYQRLINMGLKMRITVLIVLAIFFQSYAFADALDYRLQQKAQQTQQFEQQRADNARRMYEERQQQNQRNAEQLEQRRQHNELMQQMRQKNQ